MGMIIDEAIKYLRALKRCETCEEGDIGHCKSCSCYRIGSSAKCYDAIDVGIDTMLKYQKIEQIVNSNPDYIHHTDIDTYKLNSIREVIEDADSKNN